MRRPLHRELVLAIPAAFLLLSADRLSPDRLPPPPAFANSWKEAAPTLPGRNAGRGGRAGDPLNLVFVGSPAAVRAALTGAGWTEIPGATRASLAAGLAEMLSGRPLASFPPMNDYFLKGRRQDMNWARPVRPLQERHHFRLWRTGDADPSGRAYWWGSGNYDLKIRWRDLSHIPDPDADRERDFVLETLRGSPLVEAAFAAPLAQVPREGANDKGYAFRTDGRVAVVVLKP